MRSVVSSCREVRDEASSKNEFGAFQASQNTSTCKISYINQNDVLQAKVQYAMNINFPSHQFPPKSPYFFLENLVQDLYGLQTPLRKAPLDARRTG